MCRRPAQCAVVSFATHSSQEGGENATMTQYDDVLTTEKISLCDWQSSCQQRHRRSVRPLLQGGRCLCRSRSGHVCSLPHYCKRYACKVRGCRESSQCVPALSRDASRMKSAFTASGLRRNRKAYCLRLRRVWSPSQLE